MALVCLDQAKRAVRVDYHDDDLDISERLAQAESVVIDYLKQPDHEWTADDVPGEIVAAILIVFSNLYERRDTILTKAAMDLVHRHRDPALA